MMTKEHSFSWAMIKVMAALPVFLAVLFMLSAGTVHKLSAQATRQEKLTQSQDTIYKKVDVYPEFPGGKDALPKYMLSNIKYPPVAKAKKITGTVYISFVVEKDGSVTNVKVMKGIGEGCDEEAVRVVSSMPKWTPGKDKGQPVRVQMVLPIAFALEAKKGDEKK